MNPWQVLTVFSALLTLAPSLGAQDPDHPSVDDVAQEAVQLQNQFKLDEFSALMQESRAMLKEAAETGSTNPDVYRALYLDATQSDDEEAARWILKLYALQPANASNAVLAAQALFSRGEPDRAIGLLAAHRDERGDLAIVGPMLATLQFATQDLEGATSTIDALLGSLDPESPMAMVIRPTVESLQAKILLYEGRPEEALELLRPLHETTPQNAGIELTLGRALFALERDDEALGHLEGLLLPPPKNFIAAWYRGLALERLGKAEAARDSFEEAYDLGLRVEDQLGSEGEALLVLSRIARELGESAHADELRERASAVGFTRLPPATP